MFIIIIIIIVIIIIIIHFSVESPYTFYFYILSKNGYYSAYILKHYIMKKNISPTWSCVSLPRSTTSSGWKIPILV